MGESWYDKKEREATEELTALLKLPVEEQVHSQSFDPWRPFEKALYGSYSSEFDNMALAVLDDLLHGTYNARDYGLAQEMFREILCTKGLCEYGTSPRSCWALPTFKELLPEYIAKWKEYYKLQWGTSDE